MRSLTITLQTDNDDSLRTPVSIRINWFDENGMACLGPVDPMASKLNMILGGMLVGAPVSYVVPSENPFIVPVESKLVQ